MGKKKTIEEVLKEFMDAYVGKYDYYKAKYKDIYD